VVGVHTSYTAVPPISFQSHLLRVSTETKHRPAVTLASPE